MKTLDPGKLEYKKDRNGASFFQDQSLSKCINFRIEPCISASQIRVFPSGGTGGPPHHDFVPLHQGLVPLQKFPENNNLLLKIPHESTS